MLKNTVLPITLVFDVEFEGHAVGMWRQNKIWGQKTSIMPYYGAVIW